MDANKPIALCRGWIGTPFHHQGRQPGVGLDCIGLLTVANRILQYDDYDRANYGRLPHAGELEAGLARLYRPVEGRQIEPGLILHFRSRSGREHCALATDQGMLHAHFRRGVVEHALSAYWRAQLAGVYRWAA